MRGLIYLIAVFLLACQAKPDAPVVKTALGTTRDSIRRDSMADEEQRAVEQENYFKFWGYRMRISGDFDGDGKKEGLREELYSRRTGKEIYKFCGLEAGEADCYWTERVNRYRRPQCVLHCSNPKIIDFKTTPDSFQTVGLIFLQNVGDLNGDGTDEVLFVEDYGGCNGGNRTARLATFSNQKWKVVKEIDVMLDQFPHLPPEIVIEPGGEKKPQEQEYEKALGETEPIIKKERGKVYYYNKDLDNMRWHLLDTKW